MPEEASDRIVDDGDLQKYWTGIPNLIDDFGLSPQGFRLYTHYKRVCGANGGSCKESARKTAERCNMGSSSVSRAKAELEESGIILITQYKTESGPGDEIRIRDIWRENVYTYDPARRDTPIADRIAEAKRSIRDRFGTPESSSDPLGIACDPLGITKRSLMDHEEEPSEEEPSEELLTLPLFAGSGVTEEKEAKPKRKREGIKQQKPKSIATLRIEAYKQTCVDLGLMTHMGDRATVEQALAEWESAGITCATISAAMRMRYGNFTPERAFPYRLAQVIDDVKTYVARNGILPDTPIESSVRIEHHEPDNAETGGWVLTADRPDIRSAYADIGNDPDDNPFAIPVTPPPPPDRS